jgi:hypothetical protein
MSRHAELYLCFPAAEPLSRYARATPPCSPSDAKLNDRDRNPAYARIKKVWTHRLAAEMERSSIKFPPAVWVTT